MELFDRFSVCKYLRSYSPSELVHWKTIKPQILLTLKLWSSKTANKLLLKSKISTCFDIPMSAFNKFCELQLARFKSMYVSHIHHSSGQYVVALPSIFLIKITINKHRNTLSNRVSISNQSLRFSTIFCVVLVLFRLVFRHIFEYTKKCLACDLNLPLIFQKYSTECIFREILFQRSFVDLNNEI